MTSVTKTRLVMVITFSVAALICGTVSAVNRNWLNPAGGTFQTPGNWSGGVVPGAMDTATFGLAGPYTVAFTGSVTNQEVRVPTGTVTLNIGAANTYTLTNGGLTGFGDSILVGTTTMAPYAQLNITSGTVRGFEALLGIAAGGNSGYMNVSGGATLDLSFYLGVGTNAFGSMTVADAGTSVETDGAVVGLNGPGFLNMQSGSSLEANYMVVGGGVGPGSISVTGGASVTTATTTLGCTTIYSTGTYPPFPTGTVLVAGAGSSWTNTGPSFNVGSIMGGGYGNGSFTVSNGATLSTAPGMTQIAADMLSTGEMIITGGGTTWTHGSVSVGLAGPGELTISDGATATGAGLVVLGETATGEGTVAVRGPGTTWDVGPFGNIQVGSFGSGDLTIEAGATVVSGGPMNSVASMPGSTGEVLLSGGGSSWTVGQLFVGGDMVPVPGGGGAAMVTVESGATLTVRGFGPLPPPGAPIADSLAIWGGDMVTLAGGTLNTPRIDLTEDLPGGGGTFVFTSGNLNLTDPAGTFTAGTLGASVGLTPTRNLSVAGTTVIESGTEIVIDGGTFSTGALDIDGALTFNRGTLSITGPAGLTIGAAGPLGSTLTIVPSQTINVSVVTMVDTNGLVALQGGRLNSSTVVNNGRIDLDGAASRLQGTVFNQGLITGDGQIIGLNNQASGVVRVSSGDHLQFTGGFFNNGEVALAGGTVEASGVVENESGGDIVGRGVFASSQLNNRGDLAFSSGITDVYGDVTNLAGGRVTISGQSDTTFWDDVTNNGALFKVAAGSSATFFGTYGGTGAITGTGTLYFESDVSPGASPANVAMSGDVNFGSQSTLHIELGGDTIGTEYDSLAIAGSATLGGTLSVSLINGFVPSPGSTFDFLTAAGGVSGTFDAIQLPALAGGLAWNAAQLYSAGILSVALAGDHNFDGSVDAADYVAWRKFDGTAGGFDASRTNFGRNITSGLSAPANSISNRSASVPEPASLLLLMLGCVAVSLVREIRRAH